MRLSADPQVYLENLDSQVRVETVDQNFPSPRSITPGVEADYMVTAWMRTRHLDYDTLRNVLNETGECVQVRAH